MNVILIGNLIFYFILEFIIVAHGSTLFLIMFCIRVYEDSLYLPINLMQIRHYYIIIPVTRVVVFVTKLSLI